MNKLSLLFFLSVFFLDITFAQTIVYDDLEGTFVVRGINAPTVAAGSKNKPYWKYFWEFGDGHYSFARAPRYCFKEKGLYKVRVSLMPYYSYEPTKVIEKEISVTQNCNNEKTYSFDGLINIDTNSDGELVPGTEIQVILNYKMPRNASTGEGYLFFFYNSDQEKRKLKLNFYPLAYRRNAERTYNAQVESNLNIETIAGLDVDTKNYLATIGKDHQMRAFAVKLPAGEHNRAFVTVAASNALDTTIIKGKKGELITNLKAIWLPKGIPFSKSEQEMNYGLRMLSVHDPNKMSIESPKGFAYYKKSSPEAFEFKVEFQNEGGRPVKKVDIAVPWPDNFDYTKISIKDRDPSATDNCLVCPETFDPEIDTVVSCFKLDTTRVLMEDSIYLTFYNVLIHGKREKGVGGGRFTKGFITFSAPSNKKAIDKTKIGARITFEGGEDFFTRYARKNWRHKSLNLKIGRNFNHQLDGFETTNAWSDFDKWFNAGFIFRNAALRQGIGWGTELSFAAFGFDNRNTDEVFDPNGGISFINFNREKINMVTIDVIPHLEYKLFGAVSAGVGAGISFPFKASGNIQSNGLSISELSDLPDLYEQYLQAKELGTPIPESLFEDFLNSEFGFLWEVTSRFGLLDKIEPVYFIEEEINSNVGPGGIVQWYIEVGPSNLISAGFRHDFRIYPNSYREQCLKFSNFEAYLRVKLSSFK